MYNKSRRGSVVILVALLMIPLLIMVAFAIDYGYILKVRTDLQRAVDAGVLAAVQDLVPAPDGSQDLNVVRATLRKYVAANTNESFEILDADIKIGRYEPNTFYTDFKILNDGIFDTVRVTIRFDNTSNSNVPLFFSPAFGVHDAPVTASAAAVLQKARFIAPGADILPFAMPMDVWKTYDSGDQWTIYGDGKVRDTQGNTIVGNWGTLDIGADNNSTVALSKQITDGVTQSDLDTLYENARINKSTHIDGSEYPWLNADTGLSSGIKDAVRNIHGEMRVVPIYEQTNDGLVGENLEFGVVRWGVVEVVTSGWQGGKNSFITIKKAYTYDGNLRAGDPGDTDKIIEGAYTSPILVE